MSHVLVVDDEPTICWSFRELLRDEGHEVTIASSAEEALTVAGSTPLDAIVLDVRLPGMDGISAMSKLKKASGSAPIIVMTAFGNLETALRAVDEGAFDYLTKPFELDEAADAIRRALELRGRSSDTKPASEKQCESENEIVGTSPVMQSVFRQVALVAASSAPVLITGESGTGKELVARGMHANGSRRDGPFVPVMPSTLAGLNASCLVKPSHRKPAKRKTLTEKGCSKSPMAGRSCWTKSATFRRDCRSNCCGRSSSRRSFRSDRTNRYRSTFAFFPRRIAISTR